MNYGLYLSAAGLLTGMHRLDVASNNLANVNTVGFKPDFAMVMQRDPARIEKEMIGVPSQDLLERLGGGVLMHPTRTSFAPATPNETGRSLDLAILSEGFFVVDTGRGDENERLRFTRDGRLTIDSRGGLVSAAHGMPLMDEQDRPIFVDPGATVTITPGAEVMQDGQVVARIQVTDVSDTDALRKVGENLYMIEPHKTATRTPSASLLMSGALEASGVDPIKAMMAVSQASGAVRNSARMVQLHDEMMSRAINTFGRMG